MAQKKFLEHRVGDQRILKLIDAWLLAGVVDQGEFEAAKESGTPQGGSISPLLANLYLHYVLDLWWEKKVRKSLSGIARLVRYADDFVILFRNRSDAEKVLKLLKVRFAQFGLELSEPKTHLTDLRFRQKREASDRRKMSFLGFNIFHSKTRSGRGTKIVFRTEGKRFGRSKAKVREQIMKMRHLDLGVQAKRLNQILLGHFGYFGMPGNLRRLSAFRHEVLCLR